MPLLSRLECDLLALLSAIALPLMPRQAYVENVKHTQASQSIYSINIHRTAATNALSATPSERQCRIHLVLDPNQRIQHHRAGLVQIQCIGLHPRLGGRLIWIPTVDMENLGLRILVDARILDVARLAGWLRRARGGGHFGDGAEGFALGVLDRARHPAAECHRR